MDFKLRILLELLILYVLLYFSGFLYERLIFYELFCEGTSHLRIYALTTVRGLRPRRVTPSITAQYKFFVRCIKKIHMHVLQITHIGNTRSNFQKFLLMFLPKFGYRINSGPALTGKTPCISIAFYDKKFVPIEHGL